MSGKFFWFIMLVTFAIVGHLGYVLFVPEYKMGQKMELAAGAGGDGAFRVVPEDKFRELFPGDDPSLVNAICAFDIRQHSMKIVTATGLGYWSLSVYSQKGDSYYSINDRQAQTSSLQITIEQPRDSSDSELAGNNLQLEQNKVTLQAVSPKGWVVLRLLANSFATRALAKEHAALFKCKKTALISNDAKE